MSEEKKRPEETIAELNAELAAEGLTELQDKWSKAIVANMNEYKKAGKLSEGIAEGFSGMFMVALMNGAPMGWIVNQLNSSLQATIAALEMARRETNNQSH